MILMKLAIFGLVGSRKIFLDRNHGSDLSHVKVKIRPVVVFSGVNVEYFQKLSISCGLCGGG